MDVNSYRKLTHPERFFQMKGINEILVQPMLRKHLDSSGAMQELFEAMTGTSLEGFEMEAMTYWAQVQWQRSGRPMFVLEEDVAFALSKTTPPEDPLVELPQLPFDGMYVVLPPVFEIWNDQTEMHRVEGLYLTRDKVIDPDKGEVVDGIGIIVVGETKPDDPDFVARLDPRIREYATGHNDAVQYGYVVPGFSFSNPRLIESTERLPGLKEGIRLAINLLFALTTNVFDQKIVTPRLPKSPSKLKELQRKRSTLPYRVLRFDKDLRLERKPRPSGSPAGAEAGRTMAAHVVMGHWHRFYAKHPLDPSNPKDKLARIVKVEGEGKAKTWTISRWVFPYLRGSGDPRPGNYLVQQGAK
jgi:hypothetical protein